MNSILMEVKTMAKTPKRDLKMHSKLLMDTIERQAGTLQKANLEGVMNALEARSPVVRVKLIIGDDGKAKLSISDDGIGFDNTKSTESLGLVIVEILVKFQ